MLAIEAGQALYRPSGEDHIDGYDASVDCVSLLLPANLEVRDLAQPVVVGERGLVQAAAALRREGEINDAASPLVAEGLATLVATTVLHRRPIADRTRPRWIEVVREQLEGDCNPAPTLADLADSVDRTPAHVVVTFKKTYGITVGAYVRRRRLGRAREDIEAGCYPLAEIAQRHGFSDQSHFTRQFHRLFGIAPGAYGRRV